MQLNNKTIQLISFIVVTMLLVQGCKTIPTYQHKNSLALPATFYPGMDSTSMADLPWKQLFVDPKLQLLIDTALGNNWDLLESMQRIEIANANFKQTLGPLRPAVSGVVNAGLERYSANTNQDIKNLPTGNPAFAFFVGLQSTWEIDVWNRLKNRRKAALQRLLSSRSSLQLSKTILVAEVSKRYYDLIQIDKQLAIVHKNVLLQQTAADVIVIQKQAGRATELAVRQFEAQLFNTKSLEVTYRQQLVETENELNTLLGRFPRQIARSDTMMVGNSFSNVQAGLPAALLIRRPDIQQAALDMLANYSEVDAARAGFFPTFRITPFVGFNSFKASNLFDPTSMVFGLIGGLSAPLFNRIAIESNFERAGATANAAFYNYQNAITGAYTEVATNLSRIQNFQLLYELKIQQTKALQEAVSISRDLYLAGYASYLEVILAQANVLSAELEMVDAKNKVYRAFIDLYRSLGGGWK